MADITEQTGGGDKVSAADFLASIRGLPIFIFWICLTGWTLSNLDQSLFALAIPAIVTDFNSDIQIISYILSAGFAAGAVISVVSGWLADRYGRKPVFIGTLGTSAFLVGCHAFADDILTMAILRVAGFSLSVGLGPLAMTFMSEVSPVRYRGLMTGFLQSGYPLGWFLAALLAAPITAAYGWQATFLPAFLVVPIAIALIWIMPESQRFTDDQAARGGEQAKVSELFGPAYRRRSFFGFGLYCLVGGAYAGTVFFFPTFFQEVRGFDAQTATLLVGLANGIGIIGYLGSSLVGEFFMTRRNTIALWLFIGGFALLGLIWIPTTFMGNVIWFSFTAAFFFGANAVMGTFLTELFPTRLRGVGASIVGAAALNVGFCVFPVLIPILVVSMGWQMAFTVGAVPAVFVAMFSALMIDNFKSGQDLDEVAK